MKQGSTIFLRMVVYVLGTIVLVLCLLVLPIGLRGDATGMYKPIVLGLYVTAVPFFVALHRALKLLGYIDHNAAFSENSVSTLGQIKYCALVIAGVFTAGLPYIHWVARQQDGPVIVIGALIIVLASVAFAAFAAVLQKLLQNALDIKSENDLTV